MHISVIRRCVPPWLQNPVVDLAGSHHRHIAAATTCFVVSFNIYIFHVCRMNVGSNQGMDAVFKIDSMICGPNAKCSLEMLENLTLPQVLAADNVLEQDHK